MWSNSQSQRWQEKTAESLILCRLTHGLALVSKAALATSLFMVSLANAQVSQAEGKSTDSAFSIRGFGTLGLARSTNGDAELLRDVTQPRGISNHWSARTDSDFGLQAGYRFDDSVEVVAQVVSRYRYDGNHNPQLTLGFLKYDPSPRMSFRLGRVGTEFLMQADSRLIGYSYLPIRPSMDFYGILPINYGDGIDARLRWPIGDGLLRLDGFAGYAREATPTYSLNGAKVLKGSAGYDQGPWQVRYIYAQAKLSHDFDQLDPLRQSVVLAGASSTADALGIKGRVSRYHSLGAAFDDGSWQVQGVLNYVRHDNEGPFSNSRAGYILAGRRLGSVSPFIGYSWAKTTDQKTLNTGLPNAFFAPLNSAVDAAVAALFVDQNTVTLGVRWDFARNMDLKAQMDWVRADKSSQLLVRNITPDWNGKATVFSLSLDFVF